MNFTPISFVIPVLNDEAHINRCIDSIIINMFEYDEIIVVDNGSEDKSALFAAKYSSVALFILPNVTISALRNFGSIMAKNNLLAFIDADCELDPGWRICVQKTMNDESVIATGAKYDIPKNSLWIEQAWFRRKINPVSPTNYINSGNLIVRKGVFKKIGGFNERLVTGEDAELCLRLKKNGGGILENPNIKAIHHGNPKNIIQFYNKQKWHSLGMLGTYSISSLDKPLIMTAVHLFLLISILTYVLTLEFISFASLVLLIVVLSFVPIVTTFYRF